MNLLLAGIVQAINYVLTIYLIILFVSAILRMVRADSSSGLVRTLYVLSDPPARWLGRKFPRLHVETQGQYLDLSPAVLMVGIGCVKILLEHLYTYLRFGT